jgi:hypothetical protein
MEIPPIQAGEIWYLKLILLNKSIISYDEAINSCDTFQLADDDLMAKMNEDFNFKNNLSTRLAFNDFLNDLTFSLQSEGRNLNKYGLPSPESITTELDREKCKYDKSEQLNLLRRLEHENPNNVDQ